MAIAKSVERKVQACAVEGEHFMAKYMLPGHKPDSIMLLDAASTQ